MEDGKALVSGDKAREEMHDGCGYANYLDEPFLCFICLYEGILTVDVHCCAFLCASCRELVHKPVVNACGHMFCFWCVHHAMNAGTESYCPLCRRPYIHFPRICEQLHFLLLKAVPDAYRRRCKEVYEGEVASCYFSPQFDDGLLFDVGKEHNTALPSESSLTGASSGSSDLLVSEHIEEDKVDDQEDHVLVVDHLRSSPSSSCLETNSSDLNSRGGARQSSDGVDGGVATSSPYVTVSDLLCNACKKLLYRPVVLNCGHVFCEACVGTVDDTGDATLKCFTCGSTHPGVYPHVCLELHQYLEQNFALDYGKRKIELAATSSELDKSRNGLDQDLHPTGSTKVKGLTSQPPQLHPRMHHRIGCDGCGMYPMWGRRFKCIDCPKIPGYDLCLHCHKSGTNLVGRFNQQHTLEHRMREILGSPSPFDDEFQDAGEASEGFETYFGIVGYFA